MFIVCALEFSAFVLTTTTITTKNSVCMCILVKMFSKILIVCIFAFELSATQEIDKDVEIISGKEMPSLPKQFGVHGNAQFHEAYGPLVSIFI